MLVTGPTEAYFPTTIFDWRNLDKATIDAHPIWFLKEVWGVHGKGITLIHGYDDYLKKVKETPKKATYVNGPDGAAASNPVNQRSKAKHT